jgi:hypothetical protein
LLTAGRPGEAQLPPFKPAKQKTLLSQGQVGNALATKLSAKCAQACEGPGQDRGE